MGEAQETSQLHLDSVDYVSRLAGVRIRPRAPTRIGGRMGRPEKANERKMSPAVHVLFPIGESGGSQRLVSKARSFGTISATVGKRNCEKCGKEYFLPKCPTCGAHTKAVKRARNANHHGHMSSSAGSYGGSRNGGAGSHNGAGVAGIAIGNEKVEETTIKLDLHTLMMNARKHLGIIKLPKIKAVKGLTSSGKVPEPIEKGILRARNEVFVFKDGTARFDMTDMPLTHFRPREAGLTVEQARGLGYKKDMNGKELTSEEQLLELKVQDVIPSKSCLEYFLKVARFIDELLTGFYKLKPYYNAKNIEDLYGTLCIGLAPHTSGGVLCRIIGYCKGKVCYAHPFFHAAKRRNCDGDEDALMLLMDGLLNFSRSFLPSKRGGLMDAPLVLSSRLNPNEIDSEAHNIDVGSSYPLEFYEATERYAPPKELEKIMDTVKGRLGTEKQYENFGFTHDTWDINEGPKTSAYGTFKSMNEKMEAQLKLGKKILSVDENDVAAKVISTHLLPDIIGNLNAFSKQQVRCTSCNMKYRRVPLAGKCTRTKTTLMDDGTLAKRQCGGNLTLTVHEGSVKKYVDIALKIAGEYQLSPYLKQRIELLNEYIHSLFENDKVKKMTIEQFL